MKDIYHPTYDFIHDSCSVIVDLIHHAGYQPNIIIGLARGGLVPAVILSHMLEIPMISVAYSSKYGEGERTCVNELPLITDRKILLVDEIADSGNTLYEVTGFYNHKKRNSVRTAVLYYKQQTHKVIIPNYVGVTIPEDAPFVYFPWEKSDD